MGQEHYPDDLKYHAEHDWIRVEGGEATFGVTWYAQDNLGDVVFFDPPAVGDAVTANTSYGELESVKAVSDIYAPIGGEVLAVNDAVVASPELVNRDPYGEGWLLRVAIADPAEVESLMEPAAYRDYLAGL